MEHLTVETNNQLKFNRKPAGPLSEQDAAENSRSPISAKSGPDLHSAL
jgi:hypothetical protein